jgi:hypothetical protein
MNREILALNISKFPGANSSEYIQDIFGLLSDEELEDLFSNIARTAALYGPTAFNSIELI